MGSQSRLILATYQARGMRLEEETTVSGDRIEGGATQAKGALNDVAGRLLGDEKMQAGGGADKALGKAQDSYGQAIQQLRKVQGDIEAYASAKPWMALGAALGVGLLIGHANGRSHRRIVYVHKVKPSDAR